MADEKREKYNQAYQEYLKSLQETIETTIAKSDPIASNSAAAATETRTASQTVTPSKETLASESAKNR